MKLHVNQYVKVHLKVLVDLQVHPNFQAKVHLNLFFLHEGTGEGSLNGLEGLGTLMLSNRSALRNGARCSDDQGTAHYGMAHAVPIT